MIADVLIRRYGPPHFRLVGFHLWVHGYEFPDRDDHHDGNWLLATACCEFEGSVAWVEQSPCLEAHDFPHFVQKVERLLAGRSRRAGLFPLASDFHLLLGQSYKAGLFEVKVAMEPHGAKGRSLLLVSMTNEYEYQVGLRALSDGLEQAKVLTERWPVRGIRPAC